MIHSVIQWLPITLLSILFYLSIALIFIYHHYKLPCYNTIKNHIDMISTYHCNIIGHRGVRLLKYMTRKYNLSSTTELTAEHIQHCYNIAENSLASIIYACDDNVDGIEIDCMMTNDLQCVVMHDDTIDRMLCGSGRVNEMTYDEICQYRYKSFGGRTYYSRDPADQYYVDYNTVPTLEQVIQLCVKKDVKLMIEIKEVKYIHECQQHIASLFHKYQLYNISYVATFNPIQLYQFRAHHPNIPTCLLYSRYTCTTYHNQNSLQMQPYSFINCSITRSICDYIMYHYTATYITQFIGNTMIGPESSIVNTELCGDMKQRGIAIYAWVVNHTNELLHLQHNQQICVASDYIYSSSYKNATNLLAATALINVHTLTQSNTPTCSTPTTPSNTQNFSRVLLERSHLYRQQQIHTTAVTA